MALVRTRRESAPRSKRLAIFVAATAPVLVAWMWCFLAWQLLPDVSAGPEEQQRRMIYIATEVPHTIAMAQFAVGLLFVVKARSLAYRIAPDPEPDEAHADT